MTNQFHDAFFVVSLREHAKDDLNPSIQAALLGAADEIERLGGRLRAAEAERDAWKTNIDSYACQRCGKITGLDAVVPNEVWAKITGGRLITVEVVDGKWNILCLWCIDELCVEHGIRCVASLYFAGNAICGTSQSDADQEHISRLVADRERAEAERDAWVKAVDAHMAIRVYCMTNINRWVWDAAGSGSETFPTRAEAEAAYRRAAGLEVPGRVDDQRTT